MELYQFGWEPTEEAFRFIEEHRICSREKLLETIRKRRGEAQEMAKTDQKHSTAYYSVLDTLFEKLLDEAEKTVLFEKLEPGWIYSFHINSLGARLELQHVGYIHQNKDGQFGSMIFNSCFELISIPCKLLTVDEFARIYDVERSTVLQWIRRGKLRSVRRIGPEWRISELSEPPGPKYVPGTFTWTEELSDLPQAYEFLREPASILIGPDEEDSKKYMVTIWRETDDPHCSIWHGLTAKEREKLELLLLSHPLVKCFSSDETTWQER